MYICRVNVPVSVLSYRLSWQIIVLLYYHICGPCAPHLVLQVLEFDLKGSALDSSSYIDVIVKDYETLGKDK